VPAFQLIMPDTSKLGSEEWPAPSCLVWASVSKTFANGLSGLPPGALGAAGAALVLGILLALLERFAPRPLRPYIPSPAGIGIALVMPASNGIAMFIGALAAEVIRRVRPALGERATIPVASGFIAGESLLGITVKILVVAGILNK
jgi:uncharacterized oligopeptide transporter (OPT) family protein